ncbi:MAG: HesA/MoeB/ThiF family protein [Prevotella sp.]|nr:HesA/MoeB/ThiF family protein [Bacteroides sp.]MCM1366743.1 HesA/MoeB/ThiF family protein [Prevotella sp.]MCM1437019.1 HesA/MoeB/ThiF family protein [Prevotella sp.]
MTESSKIRYSRQVKVDGIGQTGQEKISNSGVAVIGCGALGSLTAMYLAGAGIKKLVIADFDTIDVSNLHRQLFFSSDEAGMPKSDILKSRIRNLNPKVKVEVIPKLVSHKEAERIADIVDVMIDGSDNPATKYMLEKVCTLKKKPLIIAGVSGFRGQVMTILPGSTKFSEIFPEGIDGGITPCSIDGVVGPAAGVAASIMAAEAIKLFTNTGTPLSDKILTFDLSKGNFRTLEV